MTTMSVTEELERLAKRLGACSEVASATLFGSYVRGGFREGTSDIDLALVLHGDALGGAIEPLRHAWYAARVDPWIIRTDELPGLADAFATRVRDIQRAHRTITGDDPWPAIAIPRAALRLRLEQELRNHQIRLRRAVALGDAATQARQLYLAAGALRLDLALLDELVAGGGAPDRDDAALADAIAPRLELPAAELRQVLAFKSDPSVAPADLLVVARRLLDRAIAVIDSMEAT